MTNVTNKYTGMLNVAGVDVRPGATVKVDDKAFQMWRNSNGAKQWLKSGVIVTDDKEPSKKKEETDRSKLEDQARALKVDFTPETSDDDLINAILEAEEAAGNSEREALLKEARDLGLNPNANTGVEKLRKMVAEKKAA